MSPKFYGWKKYVVECCGKQNPKLLYDIRSYSNAYCFACERPESANLKIQSIDLDLKVVHFYTFSAELNLVFVKSFKLFIWSNIGQKSPFLFQELMLELLIGCKLSCILF